MPPRIALRAVALALVAGAPPAAGQVLVTPNFEVRIEMRCAEGSVSCDKVRYTGINRRTGQSIRLDGRTLHSPCADGVTPCRFLGYVFRNGNVTYTAWENGLLSVRSGDRVLLEEQGEWR
jgi:hypothetical protein